MSNLTKSIAIHKEYNKEAKHSQQGIITLGRPNTAIITYIETRLHASISQSVVYLCIFVGSNLKPGLFKAYAYVGGWSFKSMQEIRNAKAPFLSRVNPLLRQPSKFTVRATVSPPHPPRKCVSTPCRAYGCVCVRESYKDFKISSPMSL